MNPFESPLLFSDHNNENDNDNDTSLRTFEREEGVQKPYLIFKYVLEIIERHRKMKKKMGVTRLV